MYLSAPFLTWQPPSANTKRASAPKKPTPDNWDDEDDEDDNQKIWNDA
jgi:hypothetical protein